MYAAQDIFKIVERFTHTHINHAGQLIALWKAVNLVHDLTGSEVTLKSLLAGHAEKASHLASHLRRNAQRCPLSIRDIRSLHKFADTGLIKIFLGPVNRLFHFRRSIQSHFIFFFQRFPGFGGKIGHLINRTDILLVQPVHNLRGRKLRHTKPGADFCNFLR